MSSVDRYTFSSKQHTDKMTDTIQYKTRSETIKATPQHTSNERNREYSREITSYIFNNNNKQPKKETRKKLQATKQSNIKRRREKDDAKHLLSS